MVLVYFTLCANNRFFGVPLFDSQLPLFSLAIFNLGAGKEKEKRAALPFLRFGGLVLLVGFPLYIIVLN